MSEQNEDETIEILHPAEGQPPNDQSSEGRDENGKVSKISRFFSDPKKRMLFIVILGLILILAVGIGLYFLVFRNSGSTATPDSNKTTASAPVQAPITLVQSPLDGVMIDNASASRHPLAIIVENHPDARPQSGLDKASVVYEAIAEGGITRFLAIYGTYQADKIGPVRSARTYFVDWAHGFSAFLAHVGGNMDALDKIQAEKTFNLDQFAYPIPYWREYKAGLATEHTMYTSTTKLWEQAAKNGYPTANNFSVYKFKDDPDQSTLPAQQSIKVDFSSSEYVATFDYDKTTNSYKRSIAGKSQLDAIDKNQISPKNIIVMTVQRKAIVTRINEPGYNMTTVGTGKAKIFIDGKEIDGTWKKNSTADREIFYDSTGAEITFNRGQFWICVIPPEATVTIQ